MFDSTKKAMQEEIDALEKSLKETTNAKTRLELENKELKGNVEDYEKAVEDLKKAHELQNAGYQKDILRLKEEVEYEQNRPRPGVTRIDREGLEVLCNGYFRTDCRVDDACKAYAVSGTFGNLNKDAVLLKLMLAKNISCDHLLQLVELLQAKTFPELSEAIGLTAFNPMFIFGQLAKTGKDKAVETIYFRSTPLDAKTTKILVCVDKVNEDTILRLLKYVKKHSLLKQDGVGYAIETDKQCIFPVDILGSLKTIRDENFVDGVGLGNPPVIPNWDETHLYEDCKRRWEQHFPHVTFLEEDQ